MQKLWQAAKDWWDSIIALSGAFMSALSLVSRLKGWGLIDNLSVFWVSIGVMILFGVIAILRARIDLIAYKRTLPNLKMTRKPQWQPKHWQNDIWRHALELSFKNIINHPSENGAARKVSATVRWKDMNGSLERENHGRWLITNRERDERKAEMQTVDIYPNDQEVTLHIAIKSRDNKHFYAWGRIRDDSHEEFELAEKRYNVEIVLSDSRGLKWIFNNVVEDYNPKADEDSKPMNKKLNQNRSANKKQEKGRKPS